MKYFIYLFSLFFLFCDSSYAQDCEKSTLKLGETYNFHRTFNNESGRIVHIDEITMSFKEGYNMNNGKNPGIDIANELKNNDYKINNGNEMRVLNTLPKYTVKSLSNKKEENFITIDYIYKFWKRATEQEMKDGSKKWWGPYNYRDCMIFSVIK